MSRRYRAVAAALLAGTLAVVASGCSGSGDENDSDSASPDKITYVTGFGAYGRDAFAWVAEEKGYFREANLDVTIELGAGTGKNLQALAADKADFVAIDSVGGWITAGQGDFTDFRSILALHQQNLVSIITLEGSDITNPKDLEGKKIAAATNSVNQLLFPAYAKLAGIDESKVEWVNAKPTALGGLLASGQVDALSTFLIGQKGIEKAAAGKKTVVLPYSTYLSDLYGNGVMATTKTLEEKPDMTKRFRDAMLKGLKYSIEHPQESAETLHKAQPAADVTAALGEITLMTPHVGTGATIGTLDKQRVARGIATLQGIGLIGTSLAPEDVVDFDLAPKAS
ncbi:MAG: ABC transporter substrate-binding protein [Dactylosporangium sp.]|nr:ABC transporter substrate-binding protein [Dactylosporangium sp.]NNJ60448.1 ABC transporter substrate-binding protein [Dactylosporangium sp.]